MFLWYWGAHRFYVGRVKEGLFWLIGFPVLFIILSSLIGDAYLGSTGAQVVIFLGILTVIVLWFIDFIQILSHQFKDKDGKPVVDTAAEHQ